jgi:hypothetical protein
VGSSFYKSIGKCREEVPRQYTNPYIGKRLLCPDYTSTNELWFYSISVRNIYPFIANNVDILSVMQGLRLYEFWVVFDIIILYRIYIIL